MISTISYYVETKGITLPDGTVFGAGKREAFRTVRETGIAGFTVYEVFGTDLVNVFGSGVNVDWGKMRDAINERIAYQNSLGNKVFLRGGEEITEI